MMTYFTVPTFGTATAIMTIRRIKIARVMTQQAALLALNDFLITLASC
jgi:hypothetical protein